MSGVDDGELEKLEEKLEESGERDRLKELLRQRLSESGWHNQVKQHCQRIVNDRGVNITVEEIVTEVTPFARKHVPDNVKKELLQQIKNFLLHNTNIADL